MSNQGLDVSLFPHSGAGVSLTKERRCPELDGPESDGPANGKP